MSVKLGSGISADPGQNRRAEGPFWASGSSSGTKGSTRLRWGVRRDCSQRLQEGMRVPADPRPRAYLRMAFPARLWSQPLGALTNASYGLGIPVIYIPQVLGWRCQRSQAPSASFASTPLNDNPEGLRLIHSCCSVNINCLSCLGIHFSGGGTPET